MNEIVLLVLGIAGVLLLISLLPPLAQRLHVPDTVLLAALGSLLGLAIGFFSHGGATATVDRFMLDFLQGLGEIELSSHLFLAVFLPILLFETALRIDGRALLPDVTVVLVMAVVAVIVTTFVAGGAVWAVSDLPLAAGLLVAAIVATTDPVAVVAVFREVGAPRRLTSIVEGESLLNDAAAIAVFAALLQIVIGQPGAGPAAARPRFPGIFVGGAAFGALTGWLAATSLARLDRGGPAEVTLERRPGLPELRGRRELSGRLRRRRRGVRQHWSMAMRPVPGCRRRRGRHAHHLGPGRFLGQLADLRAGLDGGAAAALREASSQDLLLLAALTGGRPAARALVLFGVLPLVCAAARAAGHSQRLQAGDALGRPARCGYAGAGARRRARIRRCPRPSAMPSPCWPPASCCSRCWSRRRRCAGQFAVSASTS